MVVMFQGDAGPRWSRGFPNTLFRGAGGFSLRGERSLRPGGLPRGKDTRRCQHHPQLAQLLPRPEAGSRGTPGGPHTAAGTGGATLGLRGDAALALPELPVQSGGLPGLN